jgi:branched-chain amino acid aminotransferase
MHTSVSFDQKIVRAVKAAMPALSSSNLYGNGVFTTLSIIDGNPFRWQSHWRRLEDNSGKLGIDLSNYSFEGTKNAVNDLIAENRVKVGRSRITIFGERPGSIWPFESNNMTHLLITTGERRSVPEEFTLAISPYTVNSCSPLAGVKSCNYLENLLAIDEAKGRGFDEAIRVNERGHVAGGCMSNVFWLRDGHLYTPGLATGCLPGTTREFVLENLKCREVESAIDELRSADQVYLTSAGLGIVRVAEFEGRKLTAANHPILDLWPD